jgi:hypothetical protein
MKFILPFYARIPNYTNLTLHTQSNWSRALGARLPRIRFWTAATRHQRLITIYIHAPADDLNRHLKISVAQHSQNIFEKRSRYFKIVQLVYRLQNCGAEICLKFSPIVSLDAQRWNILSLTRPRPNNQNHGRYPRKSNWSISRWTLTAR